MDALREAKHLAKRQGVPWFVIRNYHGVTWASRHVWSHTRALARAYPDGRVIQVVDR